MTSQTLVPALQTPAEPAPRLGELARVFGPVGLMSFGGPAAQIALMHRLVVDERRWLSEERFLRALNYCMLLPGPEAQQLATYIGWLAHGVRGGLICGLLFVLPGLALILTLSALYATYHQMTMVAGLFFGLNAAVVAIVAQALWRIAGRTLKDGFRITIALLAFIALFFLALPFPLVVGVAALAGFLRAAAKPAPEKMVAPALPFRPLLLLRDSLLWLIVWQVPFLLLLVFGRGQVAEIFAFFSRLAVVTFGGAYAVLSYVADVAVGHYGWLKPGEMLDGLALAETTPGPLVLVLSFVGFLAGARGGDAGLSLVGGVAGGLAAAWATFAPSFLFIFAGAPLIERLAGRPWVEGALSAVTAAVVGVILNLTLWFALHVVFTRIETVEVPLISHLLLKLPLPDSSSFDPAAFALMLFAAALIFIGKQGVGRVLAMTASLGLVWRLLA